MHLHRKESARYFFAWVFASALLSGPVKPASAQSNAEMPPFSPQPPTMPPIQAQPVAQQYSPAQLQQSGSPFNFRQYNNGAQQSMYGQPVNAPPMPVQSVPSQQQPGQPGSAFYPPMQNAPAAQFNVPAPTAPVAPLSPIPPGISSDPYVRGKELIKQATGLIASGQLDSAIEPLQKCMDFRRVDPTPQFLLGLIYDSKGNLQAALNNYTQSIKKATSLGMDSSQLRINLANTLLKLNYVKEAEFDYRRALEIDDKNDVAHLNYGRLLLFKGDNQGAFRELQRAHELMATDPNLPLYEALALKGLGNVEESRLQLQVFLERAKGINSDPRVINMAENLLFEMK